MTCWIAQAEKNARPLFARGRAAKRAGREPQGPQRETCLSVPSRRATTHLPATATCPQQLLIPYNYLVTYPVQLLVPYSYLSLTIT